MSLTRYCCLLALLPQLLCAADSIDWTPQLTTVRTEGIPVARLCFSDAKVKYAMALDTETKVEGCSGGGALFTYPKVPSARFTIRDSSIKFPFPMPEDHADFRKAALTCAPVDAIDVAIVEETNNPISINHWKSYRVTIGYTQYGRRIQHGITLLNFPSGQQAILEVSAFEKDYKEAYVRSDYLIRSWHILREDGGALHAS